MELSETADGDRATDRDLDRRFQTIERRFDKVDGKLDRLIDFLNGFRLETATRFGLIESRLTRIGTAMEANPQHSAEIKRICHPVTVCEIYAGLGSPKTNMPVAAFWNRADDSELLTTFP